MLGDKSEKMDYAPAAKGVVATEHLPPGESRKVMCPLLSGLLSSTQPHWIPLKMAQLTIELEIST